MLARNKLEQVSNSTTFQFLTDDAYINLGDRKPVGPINFEIWYKRGKIVFASF